MADRSSTERLIIEGSLEDLVDNIYEIGDAARLANRWRRPILAIDGKPSLVCDINNSLLVPSPREHFAAHVAMAAAVQGALNDIEERYQIYVLTGLAEDRIAFVVEPEPWLAELDRRHAEEMGATLAGIIAVAPHMVGRGHLSILDHFFIGASHYIEKTVGNIIAYYHRTGLDSIRDAIVSDDGLYKRIVGARAFPIKEILNKARKRLVRYPSELKKELDNLASLIKSIKLVGETHPVARSQLMREEDRIITLIHEFAHVAGFVYSFVEWLGRHDSRALSRASTASTSIDVFIDERKGTTDFGKIFRGIIWPLQDRMGISDQTKMRAVVERVYYSAAILPSMVGLISSPPDYLNCGLSSAELLKHIWTGRLYDPNYTLHTAVDELRANKRALSNLIGRLIQHVAGGTREDWAFQVRQFIESSRPVGFTLTISFKDTLKVYYSMRGL